MALHISPERSAEKLLTRELLFEARTSGQRGGIKGLYQKSLSQLSVQFSLFENPGAVIGSCELFPKLRGVSRNLCLERKGGGVKKKKQNTE